MNVTFTPDIGLFPASLTVTASAVPNAKSITPDCGVAPAFAVIVLGEPGVLVSEKFTAVKPVADAVTV